MKDKIWRITIDTNPEDCNLNCIMCEEHSQYSNFKKELFNSTGIKRRRMTKEMLIKVVSEAIELGVKEIIPTTMGDPLVSESLEHIITLCKSNNIKMNITHNGTFPGKNAKEWAELIVPITSDIKFSWNSANAETAEHIMKGLDYNKALSDLREFIAYRDFWHKTTGYYCSITFQMTFMRNNMQDIDKVIKLASELGVDRIKGHHLWVHFPEIKNLSFNENDTTRKEWNSIVINANNTLQEVNSINSKIIKLENFTPLEELESISIPEVYECPFLGKELWVSATGKISPCCAPDNLRESLGNFGNIATNSLMEIINGSLYQNLMNEYRNIDLCKTCRMRKPIKS